MKLIYCQSSFHYYSIVNCPKPKQYKVFYSLQDSMNFSKYLEKYTGSYYDTLLIMIIQVQNMTRRFSPIMLRGNMQTAVHR